MSDEMTDLEKQHAREAAALNLKQERERALASVKYPKRKTGEMNKLAGCAKSTSATLTLYDEQATPPAIADLILNTFNECIARLNELVKPKSA